MRKLSLAMAAVTLLACFGHAVAQGPSAADKLPPPSDQNDKYIWLEGANDPKALEWVKKENETAKVLEADPRFAALEADALKIAEDPNRLALPQLRGNEIYNLWRDKDHVHGILRKTTLKDYLAATPNWTTVLDFDALGKAENVKWVSHGLTCLYPGDGLCMVSLSAGGEDADTLREFDLKTGKFVEGGFLLPHSKQNVSWVDKDTLLVSRDWGAGTMTQSGYAFVVKEWKRGTPLESAKEVFRGQASDQVGSSGFTLHDAQGHLLTAIRRGVTFFTQEVHVMTPQGLKTLAIPAKAGIAGMIDGRVLVEVREDWTVAGRKFPQGSLVELKLADVLKDPERLKPTPVFEPTATEFLEGARTTANALVITTLNHVRGRAYIYTPNASGWTKKALDLPDNSTLGVVASSDKTNDFFMTVTNYLTPPSLYLGDATAGTIKMVKSSRRALMPRMTLWSRWKQHRRTGRRFRTSSCIPRG